MARIFWVVRDGNGNIREYHGHSYDVAIQKYDFEDRSNDGRKQI